MVQYRAAAMLSIILQAAFVMSAGVNAPADVPSPAPRDRAYWLAIVENGYAVPEGENAFDLLVEMNALLGSPDPVLRDDVGYGAAARWIYKDRRLSRPQLVRLLALWTGNLKANDADGPDAVLRRSFSALNLSLLAALDNDAPFLTQAEFDGLLDAAIEYLVEERDTRGFEPGIGWIHAAAHTADVLKFLARSPKLPPPGQTRIVAAIARKCSGTTAVFAWGEDDRLAQAIVSLARRADVDAKAFETALASFTEDQQKLRAALPAIDPHRYAAVRNARHVLRAAYVALALEADPPPTVAPALRALGGILARMP